MFRDSPPLQRWVCAHVVEWPQSLCCLQPTHACQPYCSIWSGLSRWQSALHWMCLWRSPEKSIHFIVEVPSLIRHQNPPVISHLSPAAAACGFRNFARRCRLPRCSALDHRGSRQGQTGQESTARLCSSELLDNTLDRMVAAGS